MEQRPQEQASRPQFVTGEIGRAAPARLCLSFRGFSAVALTSEPVGGAPRGGGRERVAFTLFYSSLVWKRRKRN